MTKHKNHEKNQFVDEPSFKTVSECFLIEIEGERSRVVHLALISSEMGFPVAVKTVHSIEAFCTSAFQTDSCSLSSSF